MSKYEQAVVDSIMKNPNITRKEMAENLGCSDSTVKRAIDGLVKKGELWLILYLIKLTLLV